MNKIDTYNFIVNNKKHFIMANNGLTKDKKYKKWLNDNNISLPIDITEQNLHDYLLDEFGKYCKCGNVNRFKKFGEGYYAFCSKKCLHAWRSDNMIGENNNALKMSNETKRKANQRLSKTLKNKIANGEWTPCVTNSWAKSRCSVKINRGSEDIIINCRSTWDAYFQLHNPNLLYEKIRIPYIWNNEPHNYIIDFVDLENKIIYEIKPESLTRSEVNKIKFKAAQDWANTNNYEFKVISNDWFNINYREDILEGQPNSTKIIRLLKQFK